MNFIKKLEEFQTLMFFKEADNYLNNILEVTLCERPDFIVKTTDNNYIGIELTKIIQTNKYYKDFNPIEKKSLEFELIQIAQKNFESRISERPNFDIYFQDNIKCSKNEYLRIGVMIADYLVNTFNNDPKEGFCHKEVDDIELKKYVREFSIMHYKGIENAFWHSGGAYIIPEIFSEVIYEAINNKEQLYKDYSRPEISSYWLILTIESFKLASTTFDLDTVNFQVPDKLQFEKIFLFDKRMMNIVKIK